jgi:hypothetical protein
LPVDKIDNTIQECKVLLKKQEATIREVAKVIGILVSVFPAVEYGPLHYRNLELQKIDQLKNCKQHMCFCDFYKMILLHETLLKVLHN